MLSIKGRLFIFLAVASAVVMNVAMKSLTSHSTYRVYVVATGIGFLLSLAGFLLFDNVQGAITFDRWMVALGVAVAVLNFAYIWIYQEGGNVSLVPLIVTALLTVLMIFVGLYYFKESISLRQYIGMGIVIMGLAVLIVK